MPQESEIVQKRFNALKLEADDLRDERELNIATMRHNVIDNKKKKIEVRALREKNTELELAISNMVSFFISFYITGFSKKNLHRAGSSCVIKVDFR